MRFSLCLLISLFIIAFNKIQGEPEQNPDTSEVLQPLEEPLETLILQLGADSQKDRDEAQSKILQRGKKALPALRKNTSQDDPEISNRIEKIIVTLESQPDQPDNPQQKKGAQILETFYKASTEEQEEMTFEILEKNLLSPLQLKQLILWHTKKDPERLSPWQWERITFYLDYEHYNYVQNKQWDNIIPFWEDLAFEPTISRRLANIYFTLDKSPEASSIPQETKDLLLDELSILRHQWSNPLKTNTPELSFYASLGKKELLPTLDFFIQTKKEQLFQLNDPLWEPHIIPLLEYLKANELNDTQGKEQAISALKEIKKQHFGLFLNLFLAEQEDEIPLRLKESFILKNILDPIIESNHTWQLAALLPTVAPTSIFPIKEWTPESVKEFLNQELKLIPQKKASKSYEPKPESLRTFIVITTMALYLNEHNALDLLHPILCTHINNEPDNSTVSLVRNYIQFFTTHKLPTLTYTLLKNLESTNNENLKNIESAVFYPETLEGLNSIFPKASTLSERFHQYHLFVSPHYGTPQERAEIEEKTLLQLKEYRQLNISPRVFDELFFTSSTLTPEFFIHKIIPFYQSTKVVFLPEKADDIMTNTELVGLYGDDEMKKNYIDKLQSHININNMMTVKFCIAHLQKQLNLPHAEQTLTEAQLLAKTAQQSVLAKERLAAPTGTPREMNSISPFYIHQPNSELLSEDLSRIPAVEDHFYPDILEKLAQAPYNAEDISWFTNIIFIAQNFSYTSILSRANMHDIKISSKAEGLNTLIRAEKSSSLEDKEQHIQRARTILIPYFPEIYFDYVQKQFPDRKELTVQEATTFFDNSEKTLSHWQNNHQTKLRYIKVAILLQSHQDKAKSYLKELENEFPQEFIFKEPKKKLLP